MSYTKTTWVNNSSPYINADNLNHIETGIKDNETLIENVSVELSDKISGTILWTNENPNSTIPTATNITLEEADTNYDVIGVYYKTSNDSSDIGYIQTISGYNINIGDIGYEGAGLRRRITRSDSTNYTIQNYNGETLSDSATGKYIIPLYIIGYKTGLF